MENEVSDKRQNIKIAIFYAIAIVLGAINGLWGYEYSILGADIIAKIFARLFRFIAIPVIATSVICTLASLGDDKKNLAIWKRTLLYTLSTTLAAASLSALLFNIYAPANVKVNVDSGIADTIASKGTYLDNLLNIVPDGIFNPIINGNVLGVLLMSLAIGIAINKMENSEPKRTITNFFVAIQDILFTFVKWLIAVLPIGIFGFVSGCFVEFSSGTEFSGLGVYFGAIITANLVQMFIILPAFLLLRGVNPIKVFSGSLKALTVAFLSKSSAATLPVTIECAEKNNCVDKRVSRFVLPICTTINMNGCAAFICITVLYLMQNAGVALSFGDYLIWIVIASIAAVGNAGVPMGCFFLSASLLSSMNVPILLMGIIMPFFNIIDMLETSLNVWSDSCVANMVNKDLINVLRDGSEEVGEKS